MIYIFPFPYLRARFLLKKSGTCCRANQARSLFARNFLLAVLFFREYTGRSGSVRERERKYPKREKKKKKGEKKRHEKGEVEGKMASTRFSCSETFNPTNSRDATLEALHSLARRLAFRREPRALHFTSVPERARMHPRCATLRSLGRAESRDIRARLRRRMWRDTPSWILPNNIAVLVYPKHTTCS